MTNIFRTAVDHLLEGRESLDDCLLLAAAGAVEAVAAWVEERYRRPGERIPMAIVGPAHYWMLDRRMRAKRIIAELIGRGVIAESRMIGPVAGVYVPHPAVARRASQWN